MKRTDRQGDTRHAPASRASRRAVIAAAAAAAAGAVLGGYALWQPPGPAPLAHAGAATPVDFSHFRVGDRNVKAMLADGDLLWVGTSGGVVRYDTRTDRYDLFDIRSGLLANGVFHLSKIGERLAVGTYGGGLALMKADGKGWDIYNVPQGLADAFVYSVLSAAGGDLWIATWSGANRVRGGALDDPAKWDTFTVKNTQGGLPNDWVYALAQGNDGSVWMATEGGLAQYRDGRWRNWKHADGLGAPYELVRKQSTLSHDPAKYSEHHSRQKREMGLEKVDVAYNPNYVVALLAARDGSVWCGTWGGGLSHFDGRAWKVYTMADGLPGNHIFMLHQDARGRVWVGTNNGLARMEAGGGFRLYTTNEGLFANNVFSMTSGRDGNLWVGSFGGVARLGGQL